MKKWDDKGFSLIELIIVIAIMAVLMVVLTPFLLNYVGEERLQKDEAALNEILHTTHIALSVDRVYNESHSTGIVVYINDGAKISSNSDVLETELQRLIPDVVEFESKEYKSRGGETIGVTYSNPHGRFILDPSWVDGEGDS